MTIYIDAIWFLNWAFDTLLLLWTGLLLKEKMKWYRVISGGMAGSLIIWLYMTPLAYLADQVWVKCLVSVLMIFTTFGYIRLKSFIKKLFVLYATTFMSGGMLLGSHYLFNFKITEYFGGFAKGTGSFGDPISWIFVIIGFPLAWHFTKKHIQTLELAKWSHEQRVTIRLNLNELELELEGLVDTGNQLLDPISGSPVAIISLADRKELLPKPIAAMVEKGVSQLSDCSSDLPDNWQQKMRIIPCKVVGNNNQLLIAFKPDAFFVKVDDTFLPAPKCLVSFTFQTLSSDRDFESIVHPKMVPAAQSVSAS